VRKIIWLRDSGRLGKLTFGHFTRFDTLGGGRYAWWGKWSVAGGGVAMTQFIHQLDLMCHIFGEPIEVHAAIDTFKAPIESEDSIAATVRFASGAMVTCGATLCAQQPAQSWDIFGTDGAVRNPWRYDTADERQRQRDLDQLHELFPPLNPSVSEPSRRLANRAFRKLMRMTRLGGQVTPMRPTPLHVPYYQAVVDAIDGGEALPVSPDEAMRSMELCTAIYVSGMTGQSVTLPLDRSNPYYKGITKDGYQLHRITRERPPQQPDTTAVDAAGA